MPALLAAFYRRYIPETPRFLLSQGRIAETNAVLTRLASGKLAGAAQATYPYISDDGSSTTAAKAVRAFLRLGLPAALDVVLADAVEAVEAVEALGDVADEVAEDGVVMALDKVAFREGFCKTGGLVRCPWQAADALTAASSNPAWHLKKAFF